MSTPVNWHDNYYQQVLVYPDVSPTISGPSLTAPGFSPQVLQLSLESFSFEGGNERSGGNINQISQDTIHSFNEDEHKKLGLSGAVPSTINIESLQIQRPSADLAVNARVPLGLEQVNKSPRSKFVCGICRNNFTAAHNLKFHIWAHFAVKPYHCQECLYRSTVPRTLKRHVATVHGRRPERSQPDFSDYPEWAEWLNSKPSTLNGAAAREWERQMRFGNGRECTFVEGRGRRQTMRWSEDADREYMDILH
ncbi:hypothetical protein K435DRAFT_797753 [Dendrothele bispora CBS 962.96]|uniref:C2H2-type domain-containing protein n=1 Tax=Dendrothele bispora (strain CBS 962.96) TaxID=1314807 RepID=A0A4S8M1D4_DENBC|nr:hypothetical protein K435DRAFT_797753 [Dendrothele bispora CBS 962.96]